MKKFAAIALIELGFLGSAALVDRVFLDVPTWVFGTSVGVAFACGLGMLLWDRKGEAKERNRLRNLLREELGVHDVQIARLKEVARNLPQQALGAEHTYAQLPDGTNIVTLPDGTIRLALPALVSFEASAGVPEASFSPSAEPPAD